MHKYYEKNSGKIKKKTRKYLVCIKDEIEGIFDKSFDDAFEEVWDYYYHNMMEKFPYIGGDSSSGTNNLTSAFFFAAFGEVGKKYGLEIDTWGHLSTICLERYIEKVPKPFKKLAVFMTSKPTLVYKMFAKRDVKNEKNFAENPGSFRTKTYKPTDEYALIYHNLECPIYTFAKENDYLEYMPYLCNLDYAMFGSLGVSLQREKTLADNDEYCDFKVARSMEIPSSWPPHILTKGDRLK